MKMLQTILAFSLMLALISSQQASAKAANKNCSMKKETSSYIDHKKPLVAGVEVGKFYKAHMQRIIALKKTGHFKNFEVVSQSVDVQPSYDNSSISTLMIRVTIKFDLNYDVVSKLYKDFKNSTINISTYEVRNC